MTRLREPFNGLSHLLGAYISLGGLALLVALSWEDGPRRISLAVYGATLTLMLAASAAYHSIRCSSARLRWFRKIDHAAIYALIAGTYTPLCYNLFDGIWRWGLLTMVWTFAVVGMVAKAFHISRDWVFTAIYLALGWSCVIGIREIFRVLPAGALAWLIAGGALYTIGAVLLASHKLDFKPGVFGYHEVWHLFVAAAAFCHYMLMLQYVAPGSPGGS